MTKEYNRGKIYRLVCNRTGLQYVGQTTEECLSKRLTKHRADYQRWKSGKRRYVTSFKIVSGGDYSIVLVENYPCSSKDELSARERHWIETLECVNKVVPTRTPEEYRSDNREKISEQNKKRYQDNYEWYDTYRKEHKDEIQDYNKEYYKQNKERIVDQVTNYYNLNRDKVLEQKREYRQANKEVINKKAREKTVCGCGSKVSRNHVSTHQKTKKHQDWLFSQSSETSSSSN